MAEIQVGDRAFLSSQYARISTEQCQKLHWASLEVLERTGVRLFDPAAVEIVRKFGAIVTEQDRVRIPSGMVEKALATVPKRVVLCTRNGERRIQIEGHKCYYGPGSDALHIVDHRTGKRRLPALRDIEEGVIICDALPNVDFIMSMFLPADVEQSLYELYQMEAMLANSVKPIIIVTHDLPSLAACVEMAEAVVGGAEKLRQNPYVTCYINATTGLLHNEEALQKLMYLAGKGLPSIYVPVCYGGMTAPVTLAGSFAAANAGVLAGLVISQLVREGAPYIVPGWGARALNMRSGAAAYFTPDDKGLMPAMGHYYGLPMFGYGGFSDSKLVDQQAALEASLSLAFATIEGANLIHDMGYLEAGLSGAHAQLVLCDEVIGWLSHAVHGVEINDETLALDLIDSKGPNGNYLDAPHTRRHFRERWMPGILDQNIHDTWEAEGCRTLGDRLNQRVEKILTTHKPAPLSEDVRAKIRGIVERETRGHVTAAR
ncbi:trimethylamine methyltransferase [bacterium]|jgi:trimethylamine--corrinoid protein Co-methyltransferase|nr:MAG: trimethylamine methyltransferase [bacterium]